MGVIYKGTNGNNTFRQTDYAQSGHDDVYMYAGNDTVFLDRTGSRGGDNYVEAGSGNDTVTNYYEGNNDIYLGRGNDTYNFAGSKFSTVGALYDVVSGGAGSDTFFIRTSHSVYRGDAGDDTFHSIGLNNDIRGGSGHDMVSYALQDSNSTLSGLGVEIDLAAGYAFTGASRTESLTSIEDAEGTSVRDKIYGNGDANRLYGLDGKDSLVGREGNDKLFGGDGNDDLYGNVGNDVLNGGLGNDILTGGANADTFIFMSIADSVVGAARDVIADFSHGEGDIIDLFNIDAKTGVSGNQAFSFIGSAGFSGAEGELRFASGILSGDVDGDGVADFEIKVTGVSSLHAADFHL